MNVASAAMVLGLLIPAAAGAATDDAAAGAPRPRATAPDDGLAGASLAALLVSIIDYCAPQGRVQLPAEAARG